MEHLGTDNEKCELERLWRQCSCMFTMLKVSGIRISAARADQVANWVLPHLQFKTHFKNLLLPVVKGKPLNQSMH